VTASIPTGAITSFRGEYKFLSNYDQHEPFSWRGNEFTSGEQAFAYAKTFCMPVLNDKDRHDKMRAQQAILFNAQTPGEAKKMGRAVKIDVNLWDDNKVAIMREITHSKFFQVREYAGKLINTGCTMLVEGNTWGDKFWGRVQENGKWVGLNTLGVILMEERGRWLG
jgi:ribA/ribD-fused uncharacterized protein